MKTCNHCGDLMGAGATECPHCGAASPRYISGWKAAGDWFFTMFVVMPVIAGILTYLYSLKFPI